MSVLSAPSGNGNGEGGSLPSCPANPSPAARPVFANCSEERPKYRRARAWPFAEIRPASIHPASQRCAVRRETPGWRARSSSSVSPVVDRLMLDSKAASAVAWERRGLIAGMALLWRCFQKYLAQFWRSFGAIYPSTAGFHKTRRSRWDINPAAPRCTPPPRPIF